MTLIIKTFNADELEKCSPMLDTYDIDIYHTIDWLILNKDLENGEIYCILIELENNKAFFPLLKRKIDNSDYYDLITPYGYGGLAFNKLADPNFKKEIIQILKSYLQDTNCISVFLRLHPILNFNTISENDTTHNGVTLVVNLDQSYENIYLSYASGHKYDLKKSKKNNNIEVIDDENFTYYDKFIEIYHDTMRYLEAKEFYYFSRQYFYDMKSSLKHKLKLIIVKHGSEVIGGSLFMTESNIIQYHLSGTSLEGRKFQPSKLILDHMIYWGVENKYTWLHLGGGLGGTNDSLYKFKKGFSADEYPFFTVRLITNNKIYSQLCKQCGYLKEEINNIDDFFPLYRKSKTQVD
jgi:lipid II:glycine glycyltransferase (peptidoglycan interpeptide bridge formation enzyme)